MVHPMDSENWEEINWKYHNKVVFRLQKRIFKAVRDGDKAKAKRLQKLVLSSRSARMLAIRQVTQLNTGKKTAGIDGKKSLTFKERFQLEETLKRNTKTWKHRGLREIPIPKIISSITYTTQVKKAIDIVQCLYNIENHYFIAMIME